MRLAIEIQGEEKSTQEPGESRTTSESAETSAHEIRLPKKNGAPQGAQHFALAARATNDAVRDWDVRSNALSWPQGLETLLGYRASAATRTIGFWQQQIHPDDRADTATKIRDALNGNAEHWAGEYRLRRADGIFLDLLERALIVRDEHGKALRFIGSLMDITARKQFQEQLARSQKMEAFGQLADGVAHDFNNFLTTILGYSDLLLSEIGVQGSIASHISEIKKAAGRASAVTGQLLAFSRKQPLEPRVVDVNPFIANLERSLLRLLGDNISVVCHLHPGKEGAHIRVDPSQLTQILLNLAVNARDAMHGGGCLTLETSWVTLSPQTEIPLCVEALHPGDYVLISVSDNGGGMTDEVKAHLFEPFFTTKHGHGSGLGLATSYGIVRQSGGNICIESQQNQGTTVKIYLPRVAPPPAPAYKKRSRLPSGTETILVLEDDIGVRHISVRVLRGLGYDVIEAANGDDAQQLLTHSGERKIDLLLTDMVMPKMSGRHFADWLRKTSPNTKVVFVSGYLEESLHPRDRLDQGTFFLAKPFDPEQLARKIREALDPKATTR
jgi:two-component system, cell cycle sensor histidine kinase and response regulator CckA